MKNKQTKYPDQMDKKLDKSPTPEGLSRYSTMTTKVPLRPHDQNNFSVSDQWPLITSIYLGPKSDFAFSMQPF